MRSRAADVSVPNRTAADPLRTRRFFLGGLAVGIVVMSAAGLAAAQLIESPSQVSARSAAPPGSVITAIARWEVLRNAVITQGVVRAPRTVTVTASAPFSTVTITRLPVKVGENVRPGRAIAEIDGRPILLLRGRIPAYRNLHEGDHGPDVLQLQRDLEGMGYADFDPPGEFGPSTSLALLLFYEHLGYQAPLFRKPAVSPRTGAAAATPAVKASPAVANPPVSTPDPASAYLPMSEVAYVPTKSALVVAINGKVGSVIGTGPVMSLATGAPYVTARLTAHQSSLVRKGMTARIVSGSPPLSAAGAVTRVGTLPAVGGPPVAGYPVQVNSRGRLPQHLIGVPVRVTIYVPVTAGPVLAVPVSAIFAAGHRKPEYVVKITASGERRRVPVFTGPSADGLIAVQPIKPDSLRPGDRVQIGVRS